MDPIITKGVADSPFPNTYASGVADAIKVIRVHVPSITAKVESFEITSNAWDEDGEYIGDVRECSCGVVLDGFYQYVDHLIAMLGGETYFGGQ